MFPNKIIIAMASVVIVIALSSYFSYQAGVDSVRATSAAKVIKAIDAARKEEQAKQEKVNEQAKKQIDDLSNINVTLNTDLDRLRERPGRQHVFDKSEAICQGASGSDLSGPDAKFLTREAARADTIRVALKACYDYADTVSQ